MRTYQTFGRQNSREEYIDNYRNEDDSRERGRSRSRKNHFQGILIIKETIEA